MKQEQGYQTQWHENNDNVDNDKNNATESRKYLKTRQLIIMHFVRITKLTGSLRYNALKSICVILFFSN